MVKLILNNGIELQVLETSTPAAINIRGGAEVINRAMLNITTANLKNAKLGNTVLTNLIATGGSFGPLGENGQIDATFTTREKTDMEIMKEEIIELQDAIIAEDEEV